jgi:hypothetical protein
MMTHHDNMSSIDYSAMFKAREDYLMVAESAQLHMYNLQKKTHSVVNIQGGLLFAH